MSSETSSVAAFREYVIRSYGTDYGVTDDELIALLNRAAAKCRARGWGTIFATAGDDLRLLAEGPRDSYAEDPLGGSWAL